jgi:hypothetical protein
VLYALRNPVFQANTNVAAPAITQVLAIWSKLDENAWSEEVTVEPSTYFYLAQPGWRAEALTGAVTVKMEIYKWAAGKWQVTTVANPGVAPGDVIGATVTGPVNFNTNFTLVDVRYDDRQSRPYVLVIAPNGQMLEREPKADKEDKTRQALALLVERDRAAAAGAVGASVPAGPNGLVGR